MSSSSPAAKPAAAPQIAPRRSEIATSVTSNEVGRSAGDVDRADDRRLQHDGDEDEHRGLEDVDAHRTSTVTVRRFERSTYEASWICLNGSVSLCDTLVTVPIGIPRGKSDGSRGTLEPGGRDQVAARDVLVLRDVREGERAALAGLDQPECAGADRVRRDRARLVGQQRHDRRVGRELGDLSDERARRERPARSAGCLRSSRRRSAAACRTATARRARACAPSGSPRGPAGPGSRGVASGRGSPAPRSRSGSPDDEAARSPVSASRSRPLPSASRRTSRRGRGTAARPARRRPGTGASPSRRRPARRAAVRRSTRGSTPRAARARARRGCPPPRGAWSRCGLGRDTAGRDAGAGRPSTARRAVRLRGTSFARG